MSNRLTIPEHGTLKPLKPPSRLYKRRYVDVEVDEKYGEPTEAKPGTEDKIEVMAERFRRNQPIFHPLDGLQVDLQLAREIYE